VEEEDAGGAHAAAAAADADGASRAATANAAAAGPSGSSKPKPPRGDALLPLALAAACVDLAASRARLLERLVGARAASSRRDGALAALLPSVQQQLGEAKGAVSQQCNALGVLVREASDAARQALEMQQGADAAEVAGGAAALVAASEQQLQALSDPQLREQLAALQPRFADVTRQQALLATLLRLRLSADGQAAAAALEQAASDARGAAAAVAAEAERQEARLSWAGGRSRTSKAADAFKVRP
jgi:hypothetical protein